MDIKCKFCGDIFHTQLSRLKIGKGKYCSRRCVDKDRKNNKKGKDLKCHCCSKTFYRSLSQVSNNNFCSHSCAAKINNLGKVRNKNGINSHPGRKEVYDWKAIKKYYLLGNTVEKCIEKFGFSKPAWAKARRTGRLNVELHPQKLPTLESILVENSKTRRGIVKGRLIREGILKYKCKECGISEWKNKKLVLHLEHKNGVYNDNRLENLCLLCPNCHSQTPTFAGRNKKYKKRL